MSSDDRRSHRRYRVENVEGSLLSAPDVVIRNISFDGAQIQTTKRLTIGRTYILKVRAGNMHMTLRGVTAWCMLRGSQVLGDGQQVPIYTAGLHFEEDRQDPKATLLRQFLDQTRSHIREQRIGGIRFRVTGRHECRVEAGCHVRQLSRGGLEVVADEPFDPDSEIEIELELDHQTIRAHCRVVSCTPRNGEETYRMGLEFKGFTEDGEEVLTRFLSDLERA